MANGFGGDDGRDHTSLRGGPCWPPVNCDDQVPSPPSLLKARHLSVRLSDQPVVHWSGCKQFPEFSWSPLLSTELSASGVWRVSLTAETGVANRYADVFVPELGWEHRNLTKTF